MHIMFNRLENTVPACGQRNTRNEGGTMAGQREHLFPSKNRLDRTVERARCCRGEWRMRPDGLFTTEPAAHERTQIGSHHTLLVARHPTPRWWHAAPSDCGDRSVPYRWPQVQLRFLE